MILFVIAKVRTFYFLSKEKRVFNMELTELLITTKPHTRYHNVYEDKTNNNNRM